MRWRQTPTGDEKGRGKSVRRLPRLHQTSNYQAYIKSEKWKAKCTAYFQLYGKRCAICGTAREIKVHHLTYERLGQERLSDLKALCQKHHLALHAAHRAARRPNLLWFSLKYIQDERKKLQKAKPNRP